MLEQLRRRGGQDYSDGPYDTMSDARTAALSSTEIARMVDFIEQLEQEMGDALSLKSGYSEIRLFTTVMRNHLSGKLTTSSSLAASSGLSYGSGMRAIASLMERGLIVKRARTSTGKSFSLHPTEKMLNEWQELTRRVRSLLGSSFATPAGGARGSDYFFGESYASGNVLPPPTIMETKLPIRQGLRILVHADPTFMAMHGLKKQFETVFGVPIKNRALSIDRLRSEIIENSRLPESRYDLIACDLPWFGEMGKADRFLPLNDLIARSSLDISDFHSEALASARYQGKQLGIPVQTTPELLVYRKDIFAEHGLAAPRTIEETITAAKKIHDPFSGGMAGIAWNAGRGTPLGHSFLFVLAAFGKSVINLQATQHGFDGENVSGENFRPMFDTVEARNTAEYFLELLNYSPRGILNMSWY